MLPLRLELQLPWPVQAQLLSNGLLWALRAKAIKEKLIWETASIFELGNVKRSYEKVNLRVCVACSCTFSRRCVILFLPQVAAGFPRQTQLLVERLNEAPGNECSEEISRCDCVLLFYLRRGFGFLTGVVETKVPVAKVLPWCSWRWSCPDINLPFLLERTEPASPQRMMSSYQKTRA